MGHCRLCCSTAAGDIEDDGDDDVQYAAPAICDATWRKDNVDDNDNKDNDNDDLETVVLSVDVLDVDEDSDLNDDRDDVAAIICCHVVSKVLHDVDVHLYCWAALPPLKIEGLEVDEADQIEPIDVEFVCYSSYSSFFFDVDDDPVFFSDVDLDADHVDVVGKVAEDDKVTILDHDVVLLTSARSR